MNEPTARIVYRKRLVNGKLMEHSDVYIEADGQTYYTRYWHVLQDTPHTRAAEVQAFKHRRAHWKSGAAA